MQIASLDHLVLTVRDLDATLAFYKDVLGMEVITFGTGRKALKFGNQKINLHVAGQELVPKAANPTPGSGDLCFLISGSLANAVAELKSKNILIVNGPVRRTGANGPLESVYVRDPDGNLVELSVAVRETV